MSQNICGACKMVIVNDDCGCLKITHPKWSKEKEMFANWETSLNKELTDVDITRMFYSPLYRYEDGELNYIEFARAILRKAQEK
jgi:hypothetical protein